MADINEISSVLTKSTSDWKKVKAKIALNGILKKKSIPALRRLIKSSSNEIIKRQAEFEIWRRELDRAPENLLKIIHHCDDEDKIGEAITELGSQKFEHAINLFIKLLKSKSSVVRGCAARALLDNPSPKALCPLLMAIKRHKENCAAFVHALEVLDCSSATEFLVDLFISKPKAPLVRINIIDCFEGKAISKISRKTGKRIKTKICKAIRKSKDNTDKYELCRFYKEVVEPKIKN